MGWVRFLYRKKAVLCLCLSISFLFWITTSGTSKQSTDADEIISWIKPRSNSTFYYVIDHLFDLKLNLLLIDPYVLHYLFIDRLSFEKLDRPLITFGITDRSIERFFPYLTEKNCSIKISKTLSLNHVFIEYQQKIIHLAILHPYHSFYLIQENTYTISKEIELFYGDVLRAVEKVKTKFHDYSFHYPRNVSHFLWLYKTSEFLHCNRSLADQMENELHLYQNASQLNLTVAPMRNIADGLDRLEKHYWLAGGTLLGWYRHCGMIPYTQDADFGLFAEEYNESIRNYFLGNPVAYLWGALGLVNDSLEFRLYTGRFTLDLFWAYRDGDHRWCGYQVNRAKFRRTLPLLPTLCSCELFGSRFSIPCSPVDYLNDEYGKHKWLSPLEKNYTWINMKYHSMWDDISWMYATRLYTREGKLRTDKMAIDWISKHFNYSIRSIPSFLNVIPGEPVTLPPLKSELVYGASVGKKRTRKKS